ncbi:MAG: ATPase domain-containing protein [Candidatus Woesearchaeota archaeon]
MVPEDIILDPSKIKRIKTYVKGLDENMQGGMPEGHIVLIHGMAGTMKSSLAFSIMYNEVLLNKRNCIYISLEQSYLSILKNMVNMGFDLTQINIIYIDDLAKFGLIMKSAKKDAGNLIIADIGCIRKQVKDVKVSENRSWLNVVKNLVLKTTQDIGVSMLTFDSMSALYTVSTFENPRMELFYFFEFLRDLKITSLMISEESNIQGNLYDNEAFLSDGIIDLRLTPFRRNMVREIKIDKMRSTKCNNDVFSFEYKNGSFYALYGGQNPLL